MLVNFCHDFWCGKYTYNMKFFVIITFAILISTNSSFSLYSKPHNTRRRVPLMLSPSTIPTLVWPQKNCDCKNESKEHSETTERNINLSLNRNSEAHVDQQFEAAPSKLTNIIVLHLIFRKNNLKNARELNNDILRSASRGNLNNSVRNYSVSDNNNNLVVNEADIKIPTNKSEITKPQEFYKSLEDFDRRFYNTTFNILTALHEATRAENGISFVQSGLLLWLTLIGVSTEINEEARNEIDENLQLNASNVEKEQIITQIITSLPNCTVDMKFDWGSRLVLRKGKQLSEQFLKGAATQLRLQIDYFKGSESPGDIADILNKMVENDSGGKIRNTFDAEDFDDDVEAILVTTIYLRARWRTAPTLLNGTHTFNSSDLPHQTVRMIRINDVVKYARLDELNAEAIEIFYFNPDLSFLILLPNDNSLRHLAHKMSETKLETIIEQMRYVRVATTLPLYTLRMTLLLPNKLRAMGISRLLSTDNTTEIDSIHITHAVQRLMFWAEAGRHAFKDDGIEWDEKPELEVLVDRPYIFYIRWKNMTLMNGNFVL